MKEMVLTVLGGMGLLIFFYLLFVHGDAAVNLVNSTGGITNTLTKTLQGR